MSKEPSSAHCPVEGCKAKESHKNDSLVQFLLLKYKNPVDVAEAALYCMQQLSDSAHDDAKANRAFASITRIRQAIELTTTLQFCILVASAEELPHYLSEAQPNSLKEIYKRTNETLACGHGTLQVAEIDGVGYLPTQSLWKIVNETAHASNHAIFMGINAGATNAAFASVVDHYRDIVKTLYERLAAGYSLDQIREQYKAGANKWAAEH